MTIIERPELLFPKSVQAAGHGGRQRGTPSACAAAGESVVRVILKSAKGAVPRRQETEGTRISAAARTRPVLRVFVKKPSPRVARRFRAGAPLLGLIACFIPLAHLSAQSANPGLQFVPLAPCRVMDTRGNGLTGAFGTPFIAGQTSRSVPVLSSACGIPASALAYSLNLTVVPRTSLLGYLTVWPTGQAQPLFSNLNSLDGSVLANAAIVPAGQGGAISVFATDDTEVVIDINGYFTAPGASTLQFYTVAPCRVLDTRNAAGPFGGPFLAADQARSFAIPSSPCGAPALAQAFSFNVTVVPHGELGYLTAWPTGSAQPIVSTLNSIDGTVLANAAIVPAANDGSVSFFATNDTDLVVDINGYFAPPGTNGLNFNTLAPCRIADTRNPVGPFGGPEFTPDQTRAFGIQTGSCGIPATAQAYDFNLTVVPSDPLGYLTVWPVGQTQPVVSTLNAPKALVVANTALVPAGTGGSIDAFVTDATNLVIDTDGFFAPGGASNLTTITDFNPKSGAPGDLVTVTGNNFAPSSTVVPQVILAKQGGGMQSVVLAGYTNTTLSFVIPTGVTSGPISITGNQQASSAVPLTVVSPSSFTLTAIPSTANLIQGQSVSYSVQIASGNGFNQLAQLSLAGIPAGVTASFKPGAITAGQTSVLTLTAPSGQTAGNFNFTLTASAIVDNFPVAQAATAQLSIQPPTTSFIGRTVVSDAQETPLAGITVSMMGMDGNDNSTGCTGRTVSDAAGNFAFINLPAQCVGLQLIGYDGTTAVSPAGKYAGVNLVYTLVAGQVTPSPVLVHLPRIDNAETFQVQQNSATDQNYSFQTIPGLALTVYAHTTFTMADNTQPNPFPLSAVHVPVDRLPDLKPPVPTMINVYIIAFQPANVTTNQPVAVYYPNPLNSPPGTNMALLTLDPTRGKMVPYGTGTVSADGTQIVPDPDPASPGHLFGIVHFDWHGPMPAPPPQNNPAPPDSGGDPDWPGGGSGPGNGDGGNGNGDGDGGGGGTSQQPDPNAPGTCNACPCPATSGTAMPLAPLLPEGQASNELPLKSPEGSDPPFVSGQSAEAGDPVDLSSGIQTLTHRDLVIRGSRGSIILNRSYRSLTTAAGPFGIGTNHSYNFGLDTAFPTLVAAINLIMPDGNRFLLTKHACPAIASSGGVFPCPSGLTNSNIPALTGANLTVNSDNTADLRWKNGTIYHFVPISFQVGSLLETVTDRNGNTITIAHDGSGNVTSITDPVGRSLTFTYDSSSRVTSIVDPIGRTTQYTYNAQGSLDTFTNPAGGVTHYAYDSNNNLLQLTDPRGIVQIQNTLDSTGRVIKQVRSDGGTLTFSYTLANPTVVVTPLLAAQVTDSNGVQGTYRFNTDGYLTDVTSTQGQTTHIELQDGTNLRSGVVTASAQTTYTYDPNGNILTATDPTGLTTTYTYDPVFSNVTSVTDPLGNVTSYAYDSKGNLVSLTDANGNTTSYQYDANGLLTKITDPLQNATTYGYDGLGNLLSVTDPLGNVTTHGYDPLSRLILTVDPLNRRNSIAYDLLGRAVTAMNAKGGVTAFVYDADSNLSSVTDANGHSNTFTYDPMNRLISRTDGLMNSDMRTWDTNGNLTQYVDRRGQTSAFAYDNLNRLTSETYSDATVARTYDVYGRIAQIADSASGAFTFGYDLAGRLLNSSTPFGTVQYTYDGRGLTASRQVVGQPVLSHTYDAVGNLASAAMPQGSATFTYDARNILSGINRANGVGSAYVYDAAAQLSSITHSKGSSMLDAESYGYDPVGNRNSHTTSIGQSLITPATANTFNAANQLTQFGTTTNTFDGNGNLAQEAGAATYAWDGRNRLKSITTAAGQVTNFTYGPDGELLQQSDSGPTLNQTKTFILDDLTNVAFETATDGSSYSVLAGRSLDSHLGTVQANGALQYGLSDAINSTIATVDQSGAVQSTFKYEPFGQTSTSGAYPFQFAGRSIVSSSLYYNRARFYNAATGRFVSEDPLGFAAGPDLYAYSLNNPIINIDRLGLDTENGGKQGKQLWGCFSAAYQGTTQCIQGASNFGVGGATGGTGDVGSNQTLNESPLITEQGLNTYSPPTGDLGFNQLHTGLQNSPGTPGNDIGQCLNGVYGILKNCVLPCVK